MKKFSDIIGSMGKLLFNIFHFEKLIGSRFILGAFYDNQKSGYLIRNNLTETMVLFSGDQAVSRGGFVDGQFDFYKLEKAIKLLPLKRPSTLLNIGANIGMICIPGVSRGYFERFIAIEPDPENYKLLKINTLLNNLEEKSYLINCAVGLEKEVKSFIRSKTNRGAHKIHIGEDVLQGESLISVKVDSLNALIKDANSDSLFIVLDVEGYEGFVLAGASEILQKKPPMMIEFSPMQLTNESYVLLRDCLILNGYSQYFNLKDTDTKMQSLTGDSLDGLRSMLLSEKSMTDILVI